MNFLQRKLNTTTIDCKFKIYMFIEYLAIVIIKVLELEHIRGVTVWKTVLLNIYCVMQALRK